MHLCAPAEELQKHVYFQSLAHTKSNWKFNEHNVYSDSMREIASTLFHGDGKFSLPNQIQ